MMTMTPVVAGSTDISAIIRIVDSVAGTPETGVVTATAGLDLEYERIGSASVDITESDLAALTTAHTDGGILHIGNGYYRVDIPDAAFATAPSQAPGVLVHGTVTDMIVIGCWIPIVAVNPQDAVRGGMTALPNAAAAASGGLFVRGTGAGAINQNANGQIDVNAVHIAGSAVSTSSAQIGANVVNYAGSAVGAVDTAGYPKVTIKSGTGTGELSLASGVVDADVEAIDGDSGAASQLQRAVSGNVLVTVGAASSTTSIVTSSMSPAAAATDQFKGRIFTFADDTTTAALRGQATDITASTSGGVLTVTALTTAPASGDTGTIT
jgi:hypothetical protein